MSDRKFWIGWAIAMIVAVGLLIWALNGRFV